MLAESHRRSSSSMFATYLLLSLFLGIAAQDVPPDPPAMVHEFTEIPPSPDISWVPCFDTFTCARLQVPLDYDDPSQGTAVLAFIRIAASTQPAPNILINPGGPGGSGVDTLLTTGRSLASMLDGESHNIISFDPRGVNNSTPAIDCFPDHPETRTVFRTLYFREVSDSSDVAAANQFAWGEAYGKWCSNIFGGTGPNGTARFAGTANVAHDMLTYAEAEQRALGLPEEEAKLWYYGLSYGTVLGVTFAAMFPDRIGRMLLDGVLDAEDYYNLQWKSNLPDADEMVDRFFSDCFSAGEEKCSFWGPSTEDIQTRFDKVLSSLKKRPLPYWEGSDMPRIATYSDLKQLLILALFQPIAFFPILASVLHDLENGSGSSLASIVGINLAPDPETVSPAPADAGNVIPCIDGWGKNTVTSIEGWREHASFLRNQSKYVGDTWGHPSVDCIAMDVPPPRSGSYKGPFPPSADNTSAPIMFLSNVLDPATPIRSARKMSSLFPGSVLLAQDGIGHCTISNPSNCTIQHVQTYLKDGSLPPDNTTCRVNDLPFLADASATLGRRYIH